MTKHVIEATVKLTLWAEEEFVHVDENSTKALLNIGTEAMAENMHIPCLLHDKHEGTAESWKIEVTKIKEHGRIQDLKDFGNEMVPLEVREG